MPYVNSIKRLAIRDGVLQGVETMLDFRFGEEGLKLMPEVQEIHNYLLVEAVLKKTKTAESLEEIRQFVAEQPKD